MFLFLLYFYKVTAQYPKKVIKEKVVEAGKNYSTAIGILEDNRDQKAKYRANRVKLEAQIAKNKASQIKIWEEELEKKNGRFAKRN